MPRFIKGYRYIDQDGNLLEFDGKNKIGVYVFLDHEHRRVRYFGRKNEPLTELLKLSPQNRAEEPSDNYTQTDGYKVRQLRISLGESQAQFGKRFNVKRTAVSFWEHNKARPPKEVLEYQQAPSNASETEHPQETVANTTN